MRKIDMKKVPTYFFSLKIRLSMPQNIYFDTKIINIDKLWPVLVKKTYFKTENGGHLEKNARHLEFFRG